MINIFVNPRYKLDKKSISSKTADILERHSISSEKVLSIAFIGKRKMKFIANMYKHENVALPVLSFAYKTDKSNESYESNLSHDDATFGEVVICYPQAVLLAAEKNKTVEHTIVALIEHGIENIIYK